jgi:hypothetical protein
MHQVLLVNEGSVAVGVMAVAMAVAFLMVVGLGAYVLYCDAQNRAGERALATESGDGGHPPAAETHHEVAAETAASNPARRRRTRPPAGH